MLLAKDPIYSPRSWADEPPAHASGLALQAGVQIAGKYRLVRPAGFGGMGAVWVAVNETTGAEVAVKVLLADTAGSEEGRARFRREAHAAARLSHRGIIRVFDLVELHDEYEGTLVIVMELLRGETLGELFNRKPKLTVAETIELVVPLLSALAHAHMAGVVHRDLKPENVFLAVDPDGHVTPKILDFGISKLTTPEAPPITGDGEMLGTPSYMSPEQARGSSYIDARSDVFTVGILLYEMLSGRNPFTSGSYHSVVAAILEREPEPIAEIAPELWGVIHRALSKSPEGRYRSATELAAALRQALGLRASLPPISIPTPPSEPLPVLASEPSTLRISTRPAAFTVLDQFGIEKRRRRGIRLMAIALGAVGGIALSLVLVSRTKRFGEPPLAVLPSVTNPGPVDPSAALRATAPPPEIAIDQLPIATTPTPAPAQAGAPTAPPALPHRPIRRKHPPKSDSSAPRTAEPSLPPLPAPTTAPTRDPGF
jgi:serine/threonine-protein kinase